MPDYVDLRIDIFFWFEHLFMIKLSICFPGQFFKILFDRFVDKKSVHCRLDFLAVGSQSGPFVAQLQKIIGIVYICGMLKNCILGFQV